MNEIKVNLIITLPGRVMISEKESLHKVRRPLLNKKNKPIKDKMGKEVWTTALEPDPKKTESFKVVIGKENLVIYTRKPISATQHLNLSKEAYESFIGHLAPQNFPKKTIWLEMSEKERLQWNLRDLSKSLGGELLSYQVFED